MRECGREHWDGSVRVEIRKGRAHRGERMSNLGGGKNAQGSYDPQVAAAAQQQAATAAQAEQFSQNYDTQYIAPLLQQMTAASTQNQASQNQIAGLETQQLKSQVDQQNQYGLPAAKNYYDMVSSYSAPAYAEQQATAALGDQRAAEASQMTGLKQQFGQYGISLNSPAAVAAMSDMAVKNAAVEASAQTQARSAARGLGMQLTSDAANFGRGGTSAIASMGSGASSASAGGQGATTSALGSATNSANVGLTGIQTALSGYNSQMNAYSNLDSSSLSANAQNSSGFGTALGAVLGGLASNKGLFGSSKAG